MNCLSFVFICRRRRCCCCCCFGTDDRLQVEFAREVALDERAVLRRADHVFVRGRIPDPGRVDHPSGFVLVPLWHGSPGRRHVILSRAFWRIDLVDGQDRHQLHKKARVTVVCLWSELQFICDVNASLFYAQHQLVYVLCRTDLEFRENKINLQDNTKGLVKYELDADR